MANEFATLPSHSAEYFGDTRDFWWNRDFLDLMARRLSFDRVRDALDVGCGVGHWTHLIASMLSHEARISGVDRDGFWIESAQKRAAARALDDRIRFCQASAESLPFADASFDLVTCQTLLIHVPDPAAVLGEMMRVARPGGLILACEPNNLSRALIFDSLGSKVATEDVLACVRLQLTCERGKAALGEGDNSIGDLMPGLFSDAGLVDVSVYLNDKTNWLAPPYDTPEQRAMLEEQADLANRDFWIWSRDDTQRYYLAGGGAADQFDALWSIAVTGSDDFRRAIAERSYSSAGGSITYLVAGRKPGEQASLKRSAP